MNLEKEIFKKYKVNYKKLEKYGFKKEFDCYVYSKIFFDNNFKAIININNKGILVGKVIDLDTEFEYSNIRIENIGSFANKVKEFYKEILIDIRNNCYDKILFTSKNLNNICKYIMNNYSSTPEFLWDKYPNFCVFRNSKNKKWFALVANLKGDYFGISNDVDVINLKIDELRLNELLKIDGIYKAYHMNKKSWISIVIDGRIDLSFLKKLIKNSYDLIDKK